MSYQCMEDGLVSIIVPIYNSEKSLDQCIKSLRSQTYKNIEIILIDDGSKDRSFEICERYSAQDKRIKLYRQKNSGAGKARNNGLKHAIGEYIAFCDSDDYADDKWIAVLKDGMTNDVDLSIIEFKSVSGYDDTFNDPVAPFNFHELRFIWDIFYRGKLSSLFTKLYRAQIIKDNNITFTSDRDGEDSIFNLIYVSKMKKGFRYSPTRLYAYVYNPNSITNNYVDNMWQNGMKRMALLKKVMEGIGISFSAIETEYSIKCADLAERCMYNELKREQSLAKQANSIHEIIRNEPLRQAAARIPDSKKSKVTRMVERLNFSYYSALIFVMISRSKRFLHR